MAVRIFRGGRPADLRICVFAQVSDRLTAGASCPKVRGSSSADRGRGTGVRVACVGEWGATHWSNVVRGPGLAPRRGIREGSGLRRQLPGTGSRSVPGWSEGSGPLPLCCKGYFCPWPPLRLRRGPAPSAALVAVLAGLALALCFEPYELPVLLPLGVAGFMLAVHGVRSRRGLWLGLLTGVGVHVRAPVLDAVGRLRRLAVLSSLETAFFVPLGGACAAVSRLPRLAGVDRRALGRRRGVAVRLAVRRDALGAARLRHRRHARSAPPCPTSARPA